MARAGHSVSAPPLQTEGRRLEVVCGGGGGAGRTEVEPCRLLLSLLSLTDAGLLELLLLSQSYITS